MRGRSDTSDGEFEDALDSLPAAAFSSSRQYDGGTDGASSSAGYVLAKGLPISSTSGHTAALVFPSSSTAMSSTTVFSRSESPTIRSVATATRHNRLELLRSRMRQEFGQLSAGSEDAVSECTSLASWGRNLLMEQQPIGDSATTGIGNCPTVRPLDSMSTRAVLAPSRHFSDGLEDAERHPPSYFLFDRSAASLEYDDAKKASIKPVNDGAVSSPPLHGHKSVDTNRQLSDDRRLSLSPPVHPPPPLPRYLSREESQGSLDVRRDSSQQPLNVSPPKQPPLPPRRPAASLPPALPPGEPPPSKALEIVFPPVKHIVDPANGKRELECLSVQQISGKEKKSQSPPIPLQQSNSLSPKRNASESHTVEDNGHRFVKNPTFFNDYGMRRGHAKTNSLDRGLSLAKSMKSGPFPPPASSKSSSLKRDVTPADAMMAACEDEEDQRNSTAHGVIQQLAFSVLSSAPGGKPEKRITLEKGLAVVGEEAVSVSSSTSIPTLMANAKPRALSTPHYENLTIINDGPRIVKPLEPIAKELKDDSGAVPPPLSSTRSNPGDNCSIGLADDINQPGKRRMPKSNSLPRDSPKDDNTISLRKTKTLNRMESIDPVTRDVQRRMSLSSADSSYGDGASSATRIGHVKSVARSYGAAAVGFLRGAVRRSRTAVASTPISRVLAARSGGDYFGREEEDDEAAGNSTDSGGEDEAATSISETFPSASTAGDSKSALLSAAGASVPEVICRPRNTKKGPFDFEQLRLAQELSNEHTGAVWCVKFSVCGRLFATGGQDNIIRVWVLKNYVHYFTRMRERYSREADGSSSQNNLQDKLSNFIFMNDPADIAIDEARRNVDSSSLDSPSGRTSAASTADTNGSGGATLPSNHSSILVMQKPFCVFRGHTADVLDLSWSPRNYFILSCGIDRTVKLWHLTRNECLCCFQHMDFVTCIAFMPKDDRYFISGCMDGKIRLWHIPEKKVALWNEVEQSKFITAITFVRNAKFVVVGTYNGRCFFYTTDQLRYHTVIDVRSSRGKNAHGHKITSLAVHGDKLLITSNDSRIRMYDLRDMNLTRKFKGSQIERSQIRASFSPDGRHIISGSEDNYIYIWRTGELPPGISVRKDRNPMWERARAHNSVVTAAVFAPKPAVFFPVAELSSQPQSQQYRSARDEMGRNVRSASIASSSGIGLDTSTTASGSVHNRLLDLGSGPHIRAGMPPSTNFTSSLLSNSLLRNRHNHNGGDKSARGTRKASDAKSSLARASIAGGVCSSLASGGGAETFANVIVSADVSGSLKIFVNPAPLKAGGSSFFPQ